MKNSTKQLKEQILKRKIRLQEIKDALNEDFVGLEKIVDEIIDLLHPWYVFPESQLRPTVINLWGLTGTGKTALVLRLVELLDFDNSFVQVDVGEFNSDNTGGGLKSLLSSDLNHHNGKEVILCLDEFQLARTLNEDGNELGKNSLRVVWDLIDSGKFFYNSRPSQYYISRGFKALKLLNQCMQNDVEIANGKIIKNLEFFQTTFKGFSFNYYSPKKKAFKANYFIQDDFIGALNSLIGDKYVSKYQIIEDVKALPDMEALLMFLAEAISQEGALKTMDLSKALIFIIGNLDEAYYMSHNINPDISADDFYDSTMKITIANIKAALQKRFRNEQIARLGNNHILYPAFNEANYILFIKKQLGMIQTNVKKQFGIDIEFSDSLEDILYKEGVFPTQGARPVMTTVKNLVESKVSQVVCDIIENEWNVKRIHWAYEEEEYHVTFFGTRKKALAKKAYPVNLKVNSLRKSRNNDLQAYVAVHESGHAILAALTTRILPDLVVTQTVSNDASGFTKTNMPDDLMTRELMEKDITVCLGGYLAEKMLFGADNTSTGVRQDIHRATVNANKIVKQFAMGEDPVKISVEDSENNYEFFHEQRHADEARKVIKACEVVGQELLERNKFLLLKMSEYLTIHSRMDKAKIEEYIVEYSVEPWVKAEGFIEAENYFDFKAIIQKELKKIERDTLV